jgi:hypothetical protein
MDNFARHGVSQINVGTHIKTEPCVRPLRRTGAPRINYKQLCAIVNALEYMMKKDWVRLPRVGTPQQDDLRVFRFAI